MSFVRNYALSKFFGNGSSGSGGGGDLKALVERTITEFEDDTIEVVGVNAFANCENLVSIKLPNATTIKQNAFHTCKALKTLEIPKVTAVAGGFVTRDCGLKKLVFPSFVTFSASYCLQTTPLFEFYEGFKTTQANVFGFATVVIRNTESLSVLGMYESYWTKILVPSVLLDDYKSATNWSNNAEKIFPLEDYTVDGTVWGELDESKI